MRHQVDQCDEHDLNAPMAIAEISFFPVKVLPSVRKTLLLAVVDFVAMALAFASVVTILAAIRPGFTPVDQLQPVRLIVDFLIAGCLVTYFRRRGHYTQRRGFWQETGEVVAAFAVALLADAAVLFFARIDPSRLSVAGIWVTGCVFLLIGRYGMKTWLIAIGRWSLPVVIIGTGQIARDLAVALRDDPLPSFQPVVFVEFGRGREAQRHAGEDEQISLEIEEGVSLPVISSADNPFEIIRQYPRAHFMIALELEEFVAARPLIDQLSHAHEDVEIALPLRGLPADASFQSHWINHDLTTFRVGQTMNARWHGFSKRLFDLVLVMAMLIFFAPLIAVVAGLVAWEGRPILFAHERIGRHGKPFFCLKFRTMAVDAQERLERILKDDPQAAREWQETRKLRNDPRVTVLGRILRKTSLDELPQLFNVLKGDMSLVGPRPVTHEEVEAYGRHKGWYLHVRPGITGLWQVSGRNQVDFGRRVHLDSWYVQNWSLLRDIAILFMTVRVVFSRDGAY